MPGDSRFQRLWVMWLVGTLVLMGLTWPIASAYRPSIEDVVISDSRAAVGSQGPGEASQDWSELVQLTRQSLRGIPINRTPTPPAPPISIPAKPPSPPRSPPRSPPAPPQIDWVAVMGSATAGGMLVVRSPDRRVRSIKVGDEFQSWSVVDFNAQQVTLQQGSDRIEIPLTRKALRNE